MENEPNITFEYEGEEYTVSGEAYYKNIIRLPNGKILKVGSWLELYPPQPYEIEDITNKICEATKV